MYFNSERKNYIVQFLNFFPTKVSIPELPGPSAGPPGRRDVASRQEQDEPPQPRHLLLPRADARHQRPP